MNKIKLKNCPFCGGRPEIKSWSLPLRGGLNFVVSCRDCGCSTWLYANKAELAIHAWNRRKEKTGTWLRRDIGEMTDLPYCSECGYGDMDTTDYCPGCGAKMEVETDG